MTNQAFYFFVTSTVPTKVAGGTVTDGKPTQLSQQMQNLLKTYLTLFHIVFACKQSVFKESPISQSFKAGYEVLSQKFKALLLQPQSVAQ